LGQLFAAYTSQITPAVDLLPVVDPLAARWEGKPLTVTLKAVVANQGNISASHTITVTFFSGSTNGGSPIGKVVIPAGKLPGCGGARQVDLAWLLSTPGLHPFSAKVEAAPADREINLSNNAAAASVLLSAERVFLPVIARAP
jgi:hypothetical protein